MSQVSLRAVPGRASGSREARRIRRTGNVPAIVYGKGTDSVSVTVDAHDLQVALHTEAGSNALINLAIEGGDTLLTMARLIEKHPFRDEYRHIDFVTISIDEKLTVEVAIDYMVFNVTKDDIRVRMAAIDESVWPLPSVIIDGGTSSTGTTPSSALNWRSGAVRR